MLPWIPRLVHTPATVDLSLPLRPWVPESTGVGGYEESAAGIGSAWEYRRDEALRLRLRAWEYEWPAVRDWIAAGQRAQSIEINLCQVGPSTPVRLISPRMGEPIVPTLTETPGVWEVEVVVRPVSGTLYEPYYDELSGVNLLRNPGFESGGANWGVPLSMSWLGPGAGAEVALTDGGAGKFHNVFTRTPITDLGLIPGALASAACEISVDSGARGRLRIVWEDASQAVIRQDDTAFATVPAWTRYARDAAQVPAGTVYVRLVYVALDVGTARFRNTTFGPGSGAPPYHSTAVMHDPARAHGGNRYLEVAGAPGAQIPIYQRTAGGVIMDYPVSPGDRVEVGGWCQRVAGDALVRVQALYYDAAGSYVSVLQTPGASAQWESYSISGVVPAGVGSLRFAGRIAAGGTQHTTARFDNVYLRVKRGPR